MKLNKSLAEIKKNLQTNRSLILKDRTQNNQVGIVIFILLLVMKLTFSFSILKHINNLIFCFIGK